MTCVKGHTDAAPAPGFALSGIAAASAVTLSEFSGATLNT